MAQKPGIPRGMRDFSPQEMVRRNYIFDTIKKAFVRYGFQQIETPAMEKQETLTGKYGDEGDQLLYRILPRGDKLRSFFVNAEHSRESIHVPGYGDLDETEKQLYSDAAVKKIVADNITEALRYDLTVPLARYVVQNQNEINFPFKRFQIQPVWRADKPQKGRYREFYQCDADIIGSDALINEVELVKIFDEVLSELKIEDFVISVNNRKILVGLSEIYKEEDKFRDLTIAIDKLDKIGWEGVEKELVSKNFNPKTINTLKDLLALKGKYEEKLEFLEDILSSSEAGMKGIEELRYVFGHVESIGLNKAELSFDPGLARGLDYYTGAIFEVKVPDFPSICGGGRYDDLTGVFGLKGLSGVGISFGADRIYDILEKENLFPEATSESTELMFVNFGEEEQDYCLPLLYKLRAKGINAEMYPDKAKMKKQMKYADSKNIRYVVMAGGKEIEEGVYTLKNMVTGDQSTLNEKELMNKLI